MSSDYGCANEVKYIHYSSKVSGLNIEMDYPLDWTFLEQQDLKSGYVNVLFSEPGKGQHLKATIMVTSKKISTLKPELMSPEALIKSLAAVRLKSEGAKVLGRSAMRVGNELACGMLLSYQALDELNSVKANLLPVKERLIVLRHGETIYILRYRNTLKEFTRFDKAFMHCLKLLKFKN